MLYEEILKKLHDEKFEYLIVGGLAVNLHGYTRATADLDIILLLCDENIKKFIDVIKPLGYKPRIPVELEDFTLLKISFPISCVRFSSSSKEIDIGFLVSVCDTVNILLLLFFLQFLYFH